MSELLYVLHGITDPECGFKISDLELYDRLHEAFSAIPERCNNCDVLNTLGATALIGFADYAFACHDAGHDLDVQADIEPELKAGLHEVLTQSISAAQAAGFTVPEEIAALTPDQLIQRQRQTLSEELDTLEEQADQAIEAFELVVGGCNDGPLKMRATKADKRFTVTLCTSDAVVDRCPSPMEYPSSVEIKRI